LLALLGAAWQRIGDYAWASVRRSGGSEWIHAVFNRAFLDRLRQGGYDVVMPARPPAIIAK